MKPNCSYCTARTRPDVDAQWRECIRYRRALRDADMRFVGARSELDKAVVDAQIISMAVRIPNVAEQCGAFELDTALYLKFALEYPDEA